MLVFILFVIIPTPNELPKKWSEVEYYPNQQGNVSLLYFQLQLTYMGSNVNNHLKQLSIVSLISIQPQWTSIGSNTNHNPDQLSIVSYVNLQLA